jgi:hypothetical protein
MMKRTILMVAIAGWSMAAAAQGPAEISPIHCLSEPELQHISVEFQGALKPYGLDKPDELGRSLQAMMSDAMDKRAKADACAEQAGDAAEQRCKAETEAADTAEKRIEKLGEDMEKLQNDLIAIRNRYRKC